MHESLGVTADLPELIFRLLTAQDPYVALGNLEELGQIGLTRSVGRPLHRRRRQLELESAPGSLTEQAANLVATRARLQTHRQTDALVDGFSRQVHGHS